MATKKLTDITFDYSVGRIQARTVETKIARVTLIRHAGESLTYATKAGGKASIYESPLTLAVPASLYLYANKKLRSTCRIWRKETVRPAPVLALMAISAVVSAGDGIAQAELAFNMHSDNSFAQSVGDANPLKWTIRISGTLFTGIAVEPFGFSQHLRIVFEETGAQAGIDRIVYAAGPSDIEDVQGHSLAAFTLNL